MSPEQAEAEDLDKRSDIYSLGIILFEMVTGQVPFTGRSPLSVAMKHKSEAPPDPQDINPQAPDDLSRLILKCLEKTKEDRYNSAEELKADLKDISSLLPTAHRKIKKKKTRTTREVTVTISPKKLYIPGLVLLVAAIAILLLWQPWKIKTIAPSASGKPTLAILLFQNNTGDSSQDNWRSTIPFTLIHSLTQSEHFRVLPIDRIYSIMEKLDLSESDNFTTEKLKQIAEIGGATHLVQGSFIKSPEAFRIYFSVQETGSMEILGSDYVEEKDVGKILSMTDEMSPKIKAFFDLTESQILSDNAVSISESMTSSREALIHYNESLRLRGVFRWKDAWESMRKAVSLDPEFAMAHLMISHWHPNEEKSRENLMKAVELKERASEWEQKFIDGYFFYREGDYLKAMESLEEVLDRVPEHRLSLRTIADIYFEIGEIEKAIGYMEKYNEYYPGDELSGIYILSRFYMFAGYFDKAKEHLERYPEDLSDQMPLSLMSCYVEMGEWDLATPLADKYYEKLPHARHLRGNIYFFQDDFASAEAEYKKNDISSRLDFIPLVQGRYKEAAERFLANLDELRKEEEISEDWRSNVVCLSHVYIQMGQPEKALVEVEKALNIDETPEFLFWMGWAQINLGSYSEALLTAEKIKRLVEQSLLKGNMRFHYLLMALIEKQNRNCRYAGFPLLYEKRSGKGQNRV
jgi:tetratricopeptide (TPR) repeat protein/serine/threonine protein kinase